MSWRLKLASLGVLLASVVGVGLALYPATSEAVVAAYCRWGGTCVLNQAQLTALGASNAGSPIRLPHAATNSIAWCDSTNNCNWNYVSESTANGITFTNGGGGYGMTTANGINVYGGGSVLTNSNTGSALTVSDAEGLRVVGVANASLATCAAGLAGTVQYDTTNSMNQLCNGTAWSPVTVGAYYSARTPISGVINSDTYLVGGLPKVGGTGQVYTQFEIAGSWATAGTGAGTRTFAVWDSTNNASRGTCTVLCTATALTPWSCGGALSGAVSGAAYGLKITSATTCATTQPADVEVTVHLY